MELLLLNRLQACKLQSSSLRVFKTPDITSLVDFLSTETDVNKLSTEYAL